MRFFFQLCKGLLLAPSLRAAQRREIGRTDKSQRSRILTKIHVKNSTKRSQPALVHDLWKTSALKQIEDDSAACKWALNYYQLTIFERHNEALFIAESHPLCNAMLLQQLLIFWFKVGEEL